MVIHYPPERLRSNSDRPSAITDVLVTTTGSSSTGEISLGAPTFPAIGYWLSGPANQPGHHPQASRPGAPAPAPPIPLPNPSLQPTPVRAA
jgi:hypothetical protein